MTAACLRIEAGLDAEMAIARVHGTRDRSFTEHAQLRYVRGWPHIA